MLLVAVWVCNARRMCCVLLRVCVTQDVGAPCCGAVFNARRRCCMLLCGSVTHDRAGAPLGGVGIPTKGKKGLDLRYK